MQGSKTQDVLNIGWLIVFIGAVIVSRSYPAICLVAVACWVMTQVVLRGMVSISNLRDKNNNDT